MTARLRAIMVALLMAATAAPALGQGPPQPPPTPPQQQKPPPPDPARGRGQRLGLRQGLPPIGPNMNMQEVQKWLDTWALIEAERVLQLSEQQYPNFVARLTRLHNVRRRSQMERQRALRELNGLTQGPGPHKDDVVIEKLKAIDEQNQRAAQEIRQAFAELDGVMTPVQRARYRLFEEQIERRKIELLSKVRGGGDAAGRGGGAPPGPGR